MKFPFNRTQNKPADPGPASSKELPANNWVLLGILLMCAALPYLNTLFNDFVYDDSVQVLENPFIQSFHYVKEIFTTSAWSFTGQGPSNYYRPMMSLGYLLCYQIFGPAAFGFHLVNIALHVAIVVGLFLLTNQLFQSRTLAFWASVIFALHPIHTESVAWIGGVTDLELTVFYLLTFYFFVKSARPGGGSNRRTQLAMLAMFILAAFSKEQALTLPLLATIYEHFVRPDREQTTLSQKLSRYDLLWIAAAAYVVLRVWLLGAFAPLSQFPDLTHTQTLLSAITLLGHYFWKLLFPVRLNAFYVFHKSVSFWDWRVLAGGGAVAGYLALVAVLRRRERRLAFALVWLLLTLLPVLNANWVGENAFAERYLYLPSVGFCWLLACAGGWIWKKAAVARPLWKAAYALGLAVLAVLCAVRIVSRNRDWHDNLTFYTQTLAASPDAYLIRIDLGAMYERLGEVGSAEQEWQKVLEVRPNSWVTLANLGMLYSRQGRYYLATEYLRRSIQANPHYADGHIKLGFTYTQMGEMKRAESEFHAAMADAPLNVASYAGLGYVYWQTSRDDEAEDILKRAEAINPADARVHTALGQFYAAKGRLDEARREYETALRFDAGNAGAEAGLRALGSKSPE
jgi:tetratricopeptide (TPR) repeat protein